MSRRAPNSVVIPENLILAQTSASSGELARAFVADNSECVGKARRIVCCRCGANYQCRPRKKNDRTYLYYECSGRTEGRTKDRCDSWSVNADKLKDFIFGEIQERVSTEEFQIALKAYLMGRLGQIIHSNVFDTRSLDREIAEFERKKRRLLDTISDGLVERVTDHSKRFSRTFGDSLCSVLRNGGCMQSMHIGPFRP